MVGVWAEQMDQHKEPINWGTKPILLSAENKSSVTNCNLTEILTSPYPFFIVIIHILKYSINTVSGTKRTPKNSMKELNE